MKIGKDFELTWLGHAGFHLRTPGGRHVLFDPWLGNPLYPEAWRTFEQVDLLLLTHGHFDHAGSAVEIVSAHQPRVVGIFEMCLWLDGHGAKHTLQMNKGGTVEVDGLTITMVHADHSSGIHDGDRVLYGGEAVGFVVRLENGFTLYHAGDTNLFGDLRLIGELYRPDLACLPIGSLFTMGPREAAKAVELLAPRWVVPMHYRTFPALTGTAEEFERHLAGTPGTTVVRLDPGTTLR